MDRRRILQATGATVAIGLAGCLDDGSGTEPATGGTESTDEPTATGSEPAAYEVPIRELWAAYDEENVTGMRATYHSEAPRGVPEDDVNFGTDVSLGNVTVADRTDGAVTVVADATVTEDGQTRSVSHTYELRREDGEWAIWRFTVGPAGSGSADQSRPAAPQVAFSFEYDGGATEGSDTAVLTITHDGGDNIDAAALFLRGSGFVDPTGAEPAVTASGANWGTATGVESVSAGTSVTVGVTSDCEISLVWESADEDTSAVLAQYDGPDA